MSQQEAWTYYRKLLKDLLTVCQLANIQQWPQLQEFLHTFAKQRPGAVARSAMHLAISGVLTSNSRLMQTPRGGVGLRGGRRDTWGYTQSVRGDDADGVGAARWGRGGCMGLSIWGDEGSVGRELK